MQCCTCSNWVHLRCSLLSFSRFKTLDSSHSWRCALFCVPDCLGGPTPTNTNFSTRPIWLPSANAVLPPHPCFQTSYPPSSHFIYSQSVSSPPFMFLTVFLYLLLPLPPDTFTVLRWNAGGLRPRSTKLLHFISSHPVDLTCMQESNLNPSFSFQIPGFSALQSDCIHSWSGILSSNNPHASNSIIIFVRQGLSFSELSTSSLSLVDPYSDYVGANISLHNSSLLSFLNIYAPPICSSLTDSRTDTFFPSILSSPRNLLILGLFNCHHPIRDSKSTSDPCGEEVFDWVISSDLLLPNDPEILLLFHHSLPATFLLTSPLLPPLSLHLLLGNALGSDHLPILLSVPLSLSFVPMNAPLLFNFRKTR